MNIFKTNTFIRATYTNEYLTTLLKSQSVNENIQALKYILCKIQEGYDFTNEFDLIVKLIDTTNPTLKKFTNDFLRYFFKHNEEDDRKLLIVNTILKDFGDMPDIAIQYVVDFSNSTSIYTYMPHIIKYIEKGGKKAYGVAFECDKKFGTDLVSKIQENWSDADYLNLASFTDLKIPENVLVSNIYNTENLLPIVRKVSYELSSTDIIDLLYKKDSIPIFYYAFKIVNTNYPDLLQDVYDTSLIHMSTSNENLYHLLILHEGILDKVRYTNSTYVIYYSDPEYIKKQKIRILFKNLDEISIREIQRYNFLDIIEFSVLKNCIIFEDVFYENEIDQVIKVLYRVGGEARLKYVVQKYLNSILNKTDTMKESTLRMFVHLCSIYFDSDVLPIITANFNTILSYYLNLFKRDVIDKKYVLEALHKYNSQYRDKIKVISELITNDIGSIVHFQDTLKIKESDKIRIDLYKNPLDCKPYQENSPVKLTSKNYESDFELKNKVKDLNVKENPVIRDFTLFNDEKLNDRIFIDHKFIKGVVSIISGTLVLSIDVLEKNTILECVSNNETKKFTLSKESKIKLCSVSDNVKLVLYEEIYNIKILTRISENVISKEVWEKEFNRLPKYKLVDSIDFSGVYKVDNEKFSFKVFDKAIFGRIYNNQIILKGSEEILREFK